MTNQYNAIGNYVRTIAKTTCSKQDFYLILPEEYLLKSEFKKKK